MKTGSGAERTTIKFLFNDGDENLLMFEENISRGLHSCILYENELFSHDLNIKTSNVWFLFKFQLIGIFILSPTTNLSLIPDYFIIARGVMMRSEDYSYSSVIYFNFFGHI